MHHFTAADIAAMDSIYRLNLINSISGYKSANLIGTKAPLGASNLAIFNSVIHLGSNPGLLGFILRPTTVPRHTYENIKKSGVFTLNHIHHTQVDAAHHTAAKYPEGVSEFDQTNLEEEYHPNWEAPFVKDAPIQIGCRFSSEYHIKENDTLLIVGSIEQLFIEEAMLLKDGWVQLDQGGVVAINGLDGYALPQLLKRLPYARPKSKG